MKKQTLVGTYVESGNEDNETLAANTAVSLDGVNNKLACPAGQTCTITSTISVQLVDHDAARQQPDRACRGTSTGTIAGEGGPFVGTTSGKPGCSAAPPGPISSPAIAAGKHTVQSFVLTQQGASLFSWTVIYNVYD